MSIAPTVISVLIVLESFAFLWLTRPIPNMTDGIAKTLNVLMGSLGTAFGQVLQYWLGSFIESKEKDGIIAEQARAA